MSALDVFLALALIAAGIALFVLANRRNQRVSRSYAERRAREIVEAGRRAKGGQGAAS